MLFATVPEAPPTKRNQRTTSCPAPISANEPNVEASRFRVSALRCVSSFSVVIFRLRCSYLFRGLDLLGPDWSPFAGGFALIYELPFGATRKFRRSHTSST